MDNKHFHHALKVSHDICIGCSHCMISCPTEAVRIRQGKAQIYENKCVDCGECFRVCPVRAIYIEEDDYAKINIYKHSIALVPSVFFGQFPENVQRSQIYDAILQNGFTDVYEVELTAEYTLQQIIEYQTNHPEKKPLISSFCPAIVRLIQVDFPSLVNNILLIKPPLDTTALYIRKKLLQKGYNPAEVGVFYITPCAAKIAALKSPVGEDISIITDVINMDTFYNKVFKTIKSGKTTNPQTTKRNLNKKSSCWALTHGEAGHAKGRCLSIDGIHNVISFLEKVENEDIDNIDFLELRACDESCAGGVLLTENRFLITEKLKNEETNEKYDGEIQEDIKKYYDYLTKRVQLKEVKPRSMHIFDENMEEAMKKMEKATKMLKCLSLTDCTACGTPTCRAFANDVAMGNANIQQCIFIQKNRELTGELTPDESLKILKNIWGKDKFSNK